VVLLSPCCLGRLLSCDEMKLIDDQVFVFVENFGTLLILFFFNFELIYNFGIIYRFYTTVVEHF
jgi:hypothetical protein